MGTDELRKTLKNMNNSNNCSVLGWQWYDSILVAVPSLMTCSFAPSSLVPARTFTLGERIGNTFDCMDQVEYPNMTSKPEYQIRTTYPLASKHYCRASKSKACGYPGQTLPLAVLLSPLNRVLHRRYSALHLQAARLFPLDILSQKSCCPSIVMSVRRQSHRDYTVFLASPFGPQVFL
jgi:hypothetical protein